MPIFYAFTMGRACWQLPGRKEHDPSFWETQSVQSRRSWRYYTLGLWVVVFRGRFDSTFIKMCHPAHGLAHQVLGIKEDLGQHLWPWHPNFNHDQTFQSTMSAISQLEPPICVPGGNTITGNITSKLDILAMYYMCQIQI